MWWWKYLEKKARREARLDRLVHTWTSDVGAYSYHSFCFILFIGPLGFFKGLESTLWRHAAWNGAYFGVIHGIRSSLPEAKASLYSHSLIHSFFPVVFSLTHTLTCFSRRTRVIRFAISLQGHWVVHWPQRWTRHLMLSKQGFKVIFLAQLLNTIGRFQPCLRLLVKKGKQNSLAHTTMVDFLDSFVFVPYCCCCCCCCGGGGLDLGLFIKDTFQRC